MNHRRIYYVPPLKEGDVSCSKCNGTGRLDTHSDYTQRCGTCHGTGKLDWIERVIGKIDRPQMVTWEMHTDKWISEDKLTKEYVDAAAERLSKDIDKSIIEMYTGVLETNDESSREDKVRHQDSDEGEEGDTSVSESSSWGATEVDKKRSIKRRGS